MATGRTNDAEAIATESRRFLALNRRFPLRPIHSDLDLERANGIIAQLLKRDDLDPAEDDYLDVLGDLVWKYENEHHPLPCVTGEEMLRHIIESRNLSQADIARGTSIAEPTISAILCGRRLLNRHHIDALARFLDISPAVFVPLVAA